MIRKTTINLVDLPLRPSKISDDAASTIFGGCAGNGARCEQKSCCDSYICVAHPNWGQPEFKCEPRSSGEFG
jgi:hypothetical protein